MGRTYDENGKSDPAKKVLCTIQKEMQIGGEADRRRSRPKWR
jgi:hypothetical protein